MSVILLVRHGENDFVKKGRLAGRMSGVHLNEKGKQQAENLAEMLGQNPIKAIYSSPLERARETAAPLAEKLGLEVISNEALIEIDAGDWQGKTVKSVGRSKIWVKAQHAPSRTTIPGGESFAQAQHRICQELEEIAARHNDDSDMVVCVSHGDPIRLAIAFFIGLPLDFFQRLHVSTASVTGLNITNSGARLMMMNYELSFNLPKF